MPDTRQILEAAQGYFSLGLFDEVIEELDGLRGEDAEAVAAVALRIEAFQARKDWGLARELAEEMARREPAKPEWWIAWAYALRREKTIQDARGVLWEAVQLHPAVDLIQYNLACYACVLGELDEARRLLARALALAPGCRAMARRDEDLKALWGELAGAD